MATSQSSPTEVRALEVEVLIEGGEGGEGGDFMLHLPLITRD